MTRTRQTGRTDQTKKHRCANHPVRMPASSRNGIELCWECMLSKKDFERKCDANYYQPGGPGYAGEP